jgi:hypothetical protein
LFLVSVVILEVAVPWPWKQRRLVRVPACLSSDWCPVLMVLTGAAFLCSYQPFARAFEVQLSQAASLFDLRAISDTYAALSSLPWKIRGDLRWVFMPFHEWTAVTVLLGLLALLILVRGLLRTRRTASA